MTLEARKDRLLPLELSRLRSVNAVCERFEDEWRKGRQPNIESFLGEAADVERSVLLGELIALEIELRRERGETPRQAEYRLRFPEREDVAAEHFLEPRGCFDETAAYSLRPGETSLKHTQATGLPAPDEWAPSDFGKFELLGVLGRGGMGEVYKALQKDLKRTVAIKMIHSVHLGSTELARRFEDEARTAAGFQHPNIVRIFEAGRIQGRAYFAMEYLPGPSLSVVLKEGPLDPKEAARLVAAVAWAVEYLHERKVVHRDLKPANILLDGRGQPCVTDFGLVKLLEEGGNTTASGAVLGTPSHMAPEQAAGRHDRVGPLSDVYGIGAILYSLVTGRPPFLEAGQIETLVQVIEGEPAPPSNLRQGIPKEIEHICMRCLEKDPADRYPSAKSIAQELDKFLRGEEIDWDRSGLWNRLRRWARREPALASRLSAALAAAGVSVVYHSYARDVSWGGQLSILGVLAAWCLASVGFQYKVNKSTHYELLRMSWLAVDVLLLSAALVVSGGFGGPLVVAYPVLVVGSGLWFRVRFVLFTTAVSVIVYITMMTVAFFGPRGLVNPHWHVVYLAGLVVMGLMVSYQVQRVRTLSRYYENRPEVR